MISHGVLDSMPFNIARSGLLEISRCLKDKGKIYFDLIRGNHKILDLQIRYKGGFTSWPQFLGVLSPEFEKLLKEGKCS